MKQQLANLGKHKGLLSFLCALPLTFAYSPFDYWLIAFIVLPLFFFINRDVDKRQAAVSGFSFGIGWFGAGISWVHVSIDQFGGLPLIVSVLLMTLLCAYLAIFPALALFIARKLEPNDSNWLWLVPVTWFVFEYFRGVFLTGFPWLSLGYTQFASPLSSLAPVIGEVGIGFLLVLTSVALAKLASKQQFKLSALIVVALVATTTWSNNQTWVSPTGEQASTVLVQGNIPQDLKWNPDQEWPTMLKYADLSRPHYGADIILWPEAAIPAIEPLAEDFLFNLDRAYSVNNSSLITGIIDYNFESKEFFNNVIVLGRKERDDDSRQYRYKHENRYSKHHLLPIGEFVPFADLLRPIAPLFNLPMSSFSRGDYVQENLVANGFHLLPLICFEVAFADQLAANFTDQTQVLMTVSNDAWFGNSHGPHQHLQIAQMRALEFGRPMLRATNNGVTAIIDHQGKVSAILPQFEEAVLTGDIEIVNGSTPYSQHSQLVFWLVVILGFTPLIFFRLKREL